MDGSPADQPYQCVDLIKAYYQYLGVSPVTGNGADYSWNSLPSGWTRVQGGVPQKGDILVYSGTPGYPNYNAGHVAIFESSTSTFHQNYAGNTFVQKVTNVAYNGFDNAYWGYIRPNWGPPYGFDYPAQNAVINTNTFLFQGWVMPESKTISSITCSVNDGQRYFETNLYVQADVPDAVGFRADIPYDILDFGNNSVSLCVNYSDGTGITIEKRSVKRVIADAVDYPVNNSSYTKGVDKITLQGWSVDQTRAIDHFTYRINDGSSVSMNAELRADLMEQARAFYKNNIDTSSLPVGTNKIAVYVHFTDGVVRQIGTKTVSLKEQAHVHSLTKTARRPATCTASGNIEYYTCSGCNLLFADANGTTQITQNSTVIPAFGHNYGDWTVRTPATCAQTGTEVRVCKNDPTHEETRDISKLTTHAETDIVIDEAVPATCISTGLSEGSHCSLCGTVIVPQQETQISSTHKWEDTATVDKEPTCTEEGLQSIHCSLCGAVKPGSQESIPAEHKWDEGKEIIKATCTEKGAKLYICSVDNETKTEEIPALGHDWGDWTVTKEATVDAEGEEQRICKRDPEHVETRVIPKKSKPSTPAPAAVEKDLYGNVVVSEAQKEKQILALTNDDDSAGSTYSLLQAQAKKVSKTSITVEWKRVSGAAAYVVYGNKCGKANKYQKIATVKGTSFTQKELKKGTYYKYLIVATGGGKALATSKTIHAATSGGKVGNAKSVKITSKKTVTLKKGKTSRIKASAVAKSSKLKMKKHRAIAFESSNPKIATVDKQGKIKGISKGKCVVYAYAQNGVMKAVKVTVK